MGKRYFIKTFGCQMNKSDSERIATVLEKIGYQPAEKLEQADLIMVNMCSVRQSAVDRIWGLAQKFTKLRNRKPNLKTVLTGCILSKDRKKFTSKFDLISNIKDLAKLRIIPRYSSKVTAYVPISTGCDNYCAYCVVPYVRGREICRPVDEILKEVKNLIKKGYKEIILLGQNVNSYPHFPKLLQKINDIPGNFWIRFTSPHPKDTTKELIEAVAKLSKVCEHIHLPIQSGDNKILKKMNRNYTVEQYRKLIREIKKTPGGRDAKSFVPYSISTDIIVGFPGETKKQFENTAKLMRWAKFDMAYIAQYSPRPGTAAAKLKDNVSPKEKKRREKVLTAILKKTALENNKKYIGKIVEVLIIGKDRSGNIQGRTRTFKNMRIRQTTDNKRQTTKFGEFTKIKITKATIWGLEGELVSFFSRP